MGGSVNLNAGANQQNWRQFETNTDKNIDFEAKAKAIAQMIYGSGRGEAENGGAGHIGLIGNKVLKFNTKWNERLSLKKDSIAYQDMKESCDNLREELKAMADVAGLKGDNLKKVLDDLGFKDGEIAEDADLLKRTTAADVLKKLVAAYKNKMQDLTKLTIAEVWEGHTPTYGNSAESFRKAVNAHNSDIFTYIQNERTALADKAVEDCDNSADAARRMADGVKQNFVKYCNTLEKWLAKTNTFFLGLVPANPNTRDQLLELKARMKAQTQGGTLEGKTIVDILAELKACAGREIVGSYTSPCLKKEFKTFEDLMKAGLEEVSSRFNAMLTELSEVKFADGSNYPNLLRSLDKQKIPKEFLPIAEDLASLASTFRKAVSEFSGIGDYVKDVELHVDYKTWNEVNTAKVNEAVQEFDEKLALADNDWAGLAEKLVNMRNAIYHADGVGPGGKKNMFFELFDTTTTLPIKRKIKQEEIAEVKSEADFKALVMSLISTSTHGGIFWGEGKSNNTAVPSGILNNHNSIPNPEAKGYAKHRGIMYQTSMEYFDRLHKLASKHELINGEKGYTNYGVKEFLKYDKDL